MIQHFAHHLLFEASYFVVFGLTLLYFLGLYFGLGGLFLFICKGLEKMHLLHRIVPGNTSRGQIRSEIRHSMLPIVVFGFSGIAYACLIRSGWIGTLPDSDFNIIFGLFLLTLWNEVHFFAVHRLMHVPFFMKHVHYIHHRSHLPTVYSVYSFHGFEALLLSTVPLTIGLFIPFAPLAVLLYPAASLLLNLAGHCNYRFGSGRGPQWTRIGTRHAAHHHAFQKTYGFATFLLDRLSAAFAKPKSN